jgi:hypothetical protein
MPGSAPALVEAERAELDALQVRGHKGGVIAPHRAMVGLPLTVWRLATSVLLTVGGLAGYLAALPMLGRAWLLLFLAGRDFLGLRFPLGTQELVLPGGRSLTIPVVATLTPLPDTRVLWVAGGISALLVLLSFLLPRRFTPLRYFLRLLALLQTSAILFFAWSPEPFPYRIEDHVFILLTSGLVVMGLVPLLLGLTLHVFDLPLWRKLLLLVLILPHLALFVPLNALLHVWLLLHGTAVIMPVLFLVFGLLLDVFVFVAFYGWALSWPSAREGRHAPPVHVWHSSRPDEGRS